MASLNMIERLHESIVAVSSAPGCGAAGIVRLAGDDAIRLASQMVNTIDATSLLNITGSEQVKCIIRLGEDTCLPARAFVFHGPHSYTGQDLVEFLVPGGPVILKMLARTACELGAHTAQPGEFTARAFLNGRLSIVDAESVNSLIYADTDTQLRAARRVKDQTFSKDLTATRKSIASILALVEADIDFAEEPIEFITPSSLIRRLAEILNQLKKLSHDTVSAEQIGVVPRVLLLGPPNAGKSTLMNQLTGLNRSICSAAAGTTRDILAAPASLPHGDVMLLDAAGLDHAVETVLAKARELTLRTAEQVDAAIIVVDVNDLPADSFIDAIKGVDIPKTIVAINKCDLVTHETVTLATEQVKSWQLGTPVLVSATSGEGLEQLRIRIAKTLQLVDASVGANAIVCSQRQQIAMNCTNDAITRALKLVQGASETIDCADVLAFELREAVNALGELLGEVATEDLLAEIFANFCIGK